MNFTGLTRYAFSLRAFWKRTDKNSPPEYEEVPGKHTKDDPFGLEQRFYRYGVKPEWLEIHRIIAHSNYSRGRYDYLVKWRELTYEQATWEPDDMQIPGINEAIDKYWLHR